MKGQHHATRKRQGSTRFGYQNKSKAAEPRERLRRGERNKKGSLKNAPARWFVKKKSAPGAR